MVTTNNRSKRIYNVAINGVNAGGAMSADINTGFEQNMSTEPDSGGAEATGYTKHTIVNPVIHKINIDLTGGKNQRFFAATVEFECKAADETKGFADMYFPTAGQARPAYVAAARGNRVLTTVHGATSIFHLMSLNFRLALKLDKESNDGDVGYTAVDAELDGMQVGGSISFQDMGVSGTPAVLLSGKLPARRQSRPGRHAGPISGRRLENPDHRQRPLYFVRCQPQRSKRIQRPHARLLSRQRRHDQLNPDRRQ